MTFPARSGADTPGNVMVKADLGAPPRGDGCAVRLVAFAPSYRASAPTPLTLTLAGDREPNASSTRPCVPVRRRWSAGRGRTLGRIGASRSAGRCGCRSPARRRRARVCAATRGWGDRAGIPGRAFRRGGVCGRGRRSQRDSRAPLPGPPPQGGRERRDCPRVAPHPDPLRASFARLDPVKDGEREKPVPAFS